MPPVDNPGKTTDEIYQNYYKEKGAYRNDLLRNPEVFFQRMAMDLSIINALRDIFADLDINTSVMLDVGCGNAESIVMFLRLGLDPNRIYGVDILDERIRDGQKRFPNVHFLRADAAHMPAFANDTFDLVYESTMFLQMKDEHLCHAIANEMLRVVKPKGFIVLTDWRYSKPFNSEYKGLSKRRIRQLFEVGTKAKLVRTYPGALLPPLGRFLSKYAPSTYFIFRGCFPFLVGQTTTIIQRI